VSTKRPDVLRLGRRGGDAVRVCRDTVARRYVVIMRRQGERPRRTEFPMTPRGKVESCVFAEGWFAKRTATTDGPVTQREVWDAFVAAEFAHLRPATRVNYTGHWRRWVAFSGEDSPCASLKVLDAKRYREEAGQRIALNQVRISWQVLRLVYRWAVQHELLEAHPFTLLRWSVGKDAPGALAPDEYTRDEWNAMLAAMNPAHEDDARLWVAMQLIGFHGQRLNSVRHLRWEDVDRAAGRITWVAAWQKQGKNVVHPVLSGTSEALAVAFRWPRGEQWVIPSRRDPSRPVSAQTLLSRLAVVEAKAGVPHRPYRGLHGGRRMVVGDLGVASGLEYVGDSPAMAKHYDRRLGARVLEHGRALDSSASRPETETAPVGGADDGGVTPDTTRS
jgi:integrase